MQDHAPAEVNDEIMPDVWRPEIIDELVSQIKLLS